MIQFPNELVTKLYGIFVYRVREDGKVLSLRTYWETEEMQVHPPFAERGA